MQNCLVSVIIPVYNVEKYLRACIDSVINQIYRNLEIILIDDGSTDSSGKICDNYAQKDTRITVIHQENSGLSAARNRGIDIAKGEYISFIDSDDYISPNYIMLLLTAAYQYNSDVVICKYIVGKELDYKFKCVEKLDVECVMDSETALEQWHGKHKKVETVAWNKLYRRILFTSKIRYPNGIYFEDVVTTHRLVERAQNVTFVNNKLYYYYQRTSSIQGATSDKKIVQKLEVQEQRIRWFDEKGYKQAYIRLLSKYMKHYMVSYVKTSNKEFKKYLLKKFTICYKENTKKFSILDRAIFIIFITIYRVIDLA